MYNMRVVYLVTLEPNEYENIENRLDIEQRLTKALPASIQAPDSSPRLAFVCSTSARDGDSYTSSEIVWLGMVMHPHGNRVGAVDKSITIDPLRRLRSPVNVDGDNGIAQRLNSENAKIIKDALSRRQVHFIPPDTGNAIIESIRNMHPNATGFLDWLLALSSPSQLKGESAAERNWQEEQDSIGSLFRIGKFSLSAIAGWKLPENPDSTYLSGIVPEPYENSLIEHDARATGTITADAGAEGDNTAEGARIFDKLETPESRCDIHVFRDHNGRHLEVANINATPAENRLGADMIYYHEPTRSFVLVQYKRLQEGKEFHFNEQLLSQMNRLDEIASMSCKPRTPKDWRLGNDSCFLKFAYWPSNRPNDPRQSADGMYLPVSYARMLLEDDCTKGPKGGRLISYQNTERYLISSQFIDLVQHGLIGTVGISSTQLRSLIKDRVESGHSVMAGAERSHETVGQRQNRLRSRSDKTRARLARKQIPKGGENMPSRSNKSSTQPGLW